MNEREFNLVDEPWICVLRKDLQVDTLSLRDVFLHGQDYLDLGCENQPQNFAVLRLLIALAYTIFSRVDENGKAMDIAEITDPDEAADEILRRWGALWKNGRFPQEPVLQYLEQYHDCFWLFDPERPFGQAPGAVRGTQYGASKLIGDISEGNNKIRIFSNRAGEEKNTLSYPEAARWLLFINAVDDASGKPKQKGLKSIGPGWVGKLGMIQSVGKNLFETILLNLTFLKDGEELWSKKANPNWEHLPKEGERTKIPVPDNLAELLTLQSRRLLLVDIQGKMAEGKSAGYKKWATKFNLKEMSKTLLFLQEQKIGSAEKLRERAAAATERYHTMGNSIKAAEARLTEIAVLKPHIINYAKTRPVYDAYRKSGYSKKFLEAHREEITLHKAAKAAFDEAGLQKLPKVKELDAEFAELLTKKKAAYPDYRKARNEMQELVRAQKNVERFFAGEKDTIEKAQTR